MAGPIDYFTPEELASLRQTASKGIGAAASPDARTAQSISDQYAQRKAALAAQRLGAIPSATSAPIGENVAPVATAEAATKPSLGQRILNARTTAGNVLNTVARGVSGLQAARGGLNYISEGPTSGSVSDVFNGIAGVLSPGIGIAGNLATAARDTVLDRVLGYKGEGQNIAGPDLQKQMIEAGGLDKLLAKQQANKPAPAPVAQPTPVAAPVAQPLTDIPEGVPASGTGFIKNETTGQVTPIGSPTTSTRTQRAPQGGVFSTLLGPVLEKAQARAFGVGPGSAQEKQAYKRQQTQELQDIEKAYKEGTIEAQNRQAGAHEVQALAALKAATTKENPNKVVQDVLGNPIIVNPATGEARKPNVKTTPSVEEFMKEAKKVNKNATDAQLQAYYKSKYGE